MKQCCEPCRGTISRDFSVKAVVVKFDPDGADNNGKHASMAVCQICQRRMLAEEEEWRSMKDFDYSEKF